MRAAHKQMAVDEATIGQAINTADLYRTQALIVLAPFRYLWNNPPSFVGKSFWLAFLTPVTVEHVFH